MNALIASRSVELTRFDEFNDEDEDDAVDFEHPAQWHLTSWGNRGPGRVDGQLRQVLTRHFGPDFVSGAFYS